MFTEHLPRAVLGGGDTEVMKTVPVTEKLQLNHSFPHSSLSQVTQAFANGSPSAGWVRPEQSETLNIRKAEPAPTAAFRQ